MAKKTSSKAKKHSSLQNHNSKLGSSSKQEDMANGSAKVSNKSTCKRKKAFPKLRGSYSLRSLNSGRVLRSRPNTEKSNTPLNPGSNPENLVKRVKKRGKMKVKKVHQDELSRIKKHIRYILNRLNYEQILIDAYSGEGWKGQSAEKIRPEKELGRAKSEILRCKLKIREIFQHLDSLLVEGRLQESLFDPDGIDSENIFCGKCGSKEVSADNDIVLCDGICERGFHQKCLNPPLLSEDIPSGDEGWLCPQCDCKAECIDLLSEFFGKDISIESSWEEIFPEAAALANVNGQHDNLNLSSDDSEDDDYNPDAQAVDVDEQKEGPVGEESDSSSSSDNNVDHATAELSTDDSEDENYDPDALDSDKEIQKTNSSSDESDFTSDSDEFCTELGKNSHAYETPSSSPNLEFFTDSGRDNMNDQDKPLDYSKFPSSILEVEKLESGLKLTNKRERERLDYKKLYEEAYGKSSSDSSDDEDWNEMNSPKKLMKIDNKKVEEVAINNIAKTTQKLQKRISSISASEKELPQGSLSTSCSSSLQKKSSAASKVLHDAFQENQYPTKDKKDSLAHELGMTMHQVTKWFGHKRHSFRVGTSRHKVNDAIKATVQEESSKKKLNEAFQENQFASKEKKQGLTQELGMTPQKILYDVFQENQYPDKEKKESLAQELGMTFLQVSKWFGNARHSFRAASMRSMHEDTCKKKLNEAFQENQNPSKEKKQELAQELGMTAQKVARWFENAQFNSRISSNESSNPMASSPDRAEASVIHKLDIAAADKTSGDKIATPKSCTSPMKPGEGIDLKAPGTPTANGDASNEKEKKAVGTTTPKRGSDNSRDGINEEDDRKKAIAKELRRMRTGR